MSWLQALLLGILQGLTEFLPVSSSGHLIIAEKLLGVGAADNMMFAVVVHAATVLSTITILWREIVKLLANTLKFKWNEETQYVCKILLSMVPVMIVGLFFKSSVEQLFGDGLPIVGICLIITALLLILSSSFRFKEKKNIGFGTAFIVGIAQAIAVLPGLSRSGTTIATGLMLGVKKDQIAQFSFLMVLIPILGEAFLDLVGGNISEATSGISISALLCGFFAAYLVGLAACKFMIELVKRANLKWFAVYCAVAGITVLIFSVIW
ncbi:MAG: undecaprenyl-diphosphate phosphatase [Bacteroidales bacterium]|jgi:undecaprenyl-diphosphatase|nr:undecaprenyl-diphosphate phosphatase [Bacteroidales bacterium]